MKVVKATAIVFTGFGSHQLFFSASWDLRFAVLPAVAETDDALTLGQLN